jgi:phosphatidylglycerol:prolipoprotein diacylglycerol transferase
LFLRYRDRAVRPGFFLALFSAAYAPIRFVMDFLRNTDLDQADVRWGGLTPAQYGMLLLTVVGLVLLRSTAREPDNEE